MKHSFYCILAGSVALILFLTLPGVTCAQEKTVPVEPSEERLNNQHKPEELMDAMGLKEGMVIADVGAGRGRLTVFFASRVGDNGLVMANDIDKNALEYLENRCEKNHITNVETFLGTTVDPGLPEDRADIIFLVSTYHHLEKPVELIRNTIPALKPDGRLVIVERDPVKTGQASSESTKQEVLISQVSEAGYELVKINTELLARDNVYFFRIGR